jgi:hypothetical protein|tara:strand:+ start:1214 stop:1597 length:384 start_codon:yes stop_codon:yes gene_type:complete
MEWKPLNSKNFLDYAIKNYENHQCTDFDEFSEDVNRIKYLKRLFSRYDQNGELKSRLILNHLIIFNNVFGLVPSSRILFFRIEEKYHCILKTFLYFLNRLPGQIPEIELEEIPMDNKILKILEQEYE